MCVCGLNIHSSRGGFVSKSRDVVCVFVMMMYVTTFSKNKSTSLNSNQVFVEQCNACSLISSMVSWLVVVVSRR
jgi:hypothetical protein